MAKKPIVTRIITDLEDIKAEQSSWTTIDWFLFGTLLKEISDSDSGCEIDITLPKVKEDDWEHIVSYSIARISSLVATKITYNSNDNIQRIVSAPLFSIIKASTTDKHILATVSNPLSMEVLQIEKELFEGE